MNEPILQFFRYDHLPPALAAISAPFKLLADFLMRDLPRNPERTVALRKLLEAKDAAVRAALYADASAPAPEKRDELATDQEHRDRDAALRETRPETEHARAVRELREEQLADDSPR